MRGRARRVRKLIGNRVHVEQGSLAIGNRPKVAVVAQWSDRVRMSRSVCTLVHALQSREYRVVVSSACEAHGALEWDGTVDTGELTVLRKPNVGYDFGSWSVAVDMIPEISSAERALFINDSMVGPFASLDPILAKFDATAADVWALTDTKQLGHHLQSYFFGFCDGVLADRALAAFWANIRHHDDKMRIIVENEIGLGRLLREEGYTQEAAFAHELSVRPGQNPVILGWKRLLEQGFPFVKREIVRNPAVAPAGDTVAEVVKQLYGVDLAEWAGDQMTAAPGKP